MKPEATVAKRQRRSIDDRIRELEQRKAHMQLVGVAREGLGRVRQHMTDGDYQKARDIAGIVCDTLQRLADEKAGA